jgi:hypothetical protein
MYKVYTYIFYIYKNETILVFSVSYKSFYSKKKRGVTASLIKGSIGLI